MSKQQTALKKDKIKKLLIDTLIILVGIITSSLGIAIFYSADLGSSPMATFCDGLHKLLPISYGMAYNIANALLLVVLVVVKRSYVGIGTIACVFVIGPFVNIFNAIILPLGLAKMNIVVRIIFVLIGTAIMGIGLGLYVAVNRGYGALEGLVKLLCETKGVSYTFAKILQDVLLVAAGILLGASWGVGTLIATMLTGPILQRSIGFFKKRLSPQE